MQLEKIFLQTVQQKQNKQNQRSGFPSDAILILDGFSAHAKTLSQIDLNNYHLKLIYLVPHSSHLCQLLDLVIFCIQKLFTNQSRLNINLSRQADKIRTIIKGLQVSCTSENIISAFEYFGIFHYYNDACINFKAYIPICIVIKDNSRFYKKEGITVPVANFRI